METTVIESMLGLTATSVENDDNSQLIFTFPNGKILTFYHDQDCCEAVFIEDITGSLDDLVGEPLLTAEERVSDTPDDKESIDDSETWTFYEFATIKGSVTVRWRGSSNGYYSESVSHSWDDAI